MINYDNFDAVLFDMDGTIFDSEVVHREAWKLTAKQFDENFTDEMYLDFIGKTTPDCINIALKQFSKPIDKEAFTASYYKNNQQLIQQGVPLKLGFTDYLQRVKSMGKKLGIVTSSAQKGVIANFAQHYFLSDFDLVITRDDVTHFKPNPEPYLLACEQLNAEPNRTIVFEDSNTGATAAIEAGCFTVGIPDLMPFNMDVENNLNLKIVSFEALI
ncbi:MAG: HAD family phosphatase [Gammaproteobacteria bacterium]|nr:HAD family phosphatase [Gammaproteobacteria bacterium]